MFMKHLLSQGNAPAVQGEVSAVHSSTLFPLVKSNYWIIKLLTV